MDRDEVHQELLAAPERFQELLRAAAPERLRERTDGTRWTNREMLFHLLLGYLVVRTLLPLMWVVTRLPVPARKGFAAVLNAGAPPFHIVNYAGSVLGGHVLSLRRMSWLFDRTCAALARRLAGATAGELTRAMPFPERWDPFFTPDMSVLNVYHYPAQHFAFHRRQLTLEAPGGDVS